MQIKIKNKTLFYKIIIIICLIAIMCGIVLAKPWNYDVANKKVKYEFEEDQQRIADNGGVTPGIQMPGYSEITIDSDNKIAKVDLYNPEANKVYFQIKLILSETGEQIYKSKLLKPGQHLYEIELKRPISEGKYNITIQYDTFSIDENYTPRNGASIKCILNAV